jgi:hypothetical protein
VKALSLQLEVKMATVSVEQTKLKTAMKEALIEVLQERSELVRDIFVEALEDMAMVNAIKAGENTKSVSRTQVMRALGATR